jgi:hypothetical protein
MAMASEADELFYGGAAGGGKTDLLLGLAGTQHWHSAIFRRTFPQTRSIIERSREVYNRAGLSHARDSYNEQLHVWRLSDGRMVEFQAVQHEKDKMAQQGRARDFLGFDELPEFPESIYRFVIGWNRSTRIDPKTGRPQRCRIVATGNPPQTVDGRWVISYWGPWLDKKHLNPAAPGELRWFAVINGEDVELDGPGAFTHRGERITPRSRTFIPARLTDNPILAATGYLSVLQGMPEPMRTQLIEGDFLAGVTDDAWQVIPTAWVEAAQARWTPEPPPHPDFGAHPLTCLGVDVAYGGADSTVIVPRHGPWFGKKKKYQGEATDSGSKAAALVLAEHDGEARIHVDAIGYGAACHEHLQFRVGGLAVAVNVARASGYFDRSRKYSLTNIRSAMYWLLREALDPETGDNLALPPDRELLADLTAPRFEVRASGIVVEAKEDIRERLGRSPDVGDAVALAHYPLGCAGVPEGLPDPPRRERFSGEGSGRLARRGMFGMGEGD